MKICSFFLMVFSIAGFISAQDEWVSFKNETILKMGSIQGWCSKEKALLIMDLIKESKSQRCLEIGVFSGMSLFPIARALKYNGSGKVFAVDAWDPHEATKGFGTSDPNYVWWSQLNFENLFKQTIGIIKKNKLSEFCHVVKKPSQEVVNNFVDESIDFIHFDGNHNEEFAFQDVVSYFPKVIDGGYILLNDPNWFSMRRALVFLLERTDLISDFTPSATYFLFRKNKQREQDADVFFEKM